MTIGRILFDLVVAGVATAGFALLFRTEAKSLLPSAILGGVGYVVYDALLLGLDSAPVAAFVAGVLVGISAEITARLRKGPAIVYATMGVIPLVPGYGLYRTMEYMVQTDYMQALAAGRETALVAGAIALSLGFSTVVARNAFRLLGLRHHRG